MSKQVIPAGTVTFGTCSYSARPAERSFRGETADQYTAKHIALFLVNLEIPFSIYKLGQEWNFLFSVLESAVPAVERFLSAPPCSRPSAEQLLKPFRYADADAGRLDLAESQHAVAQVAGHGNTEYLADLWNAFTPGSQAESVVLTSAPISAPSTPVSQPA